jgi:hypothetical protein
LLNELCKVGSCFKKNFEIFSLAIVMSSFVVQSQKYNSQEVESVIADLEKELQDEIEIAKTLDQTSEDKIASAEQFMSENESKIKGQLVKLQKLESDIIAAVTQNEKSEGFDAEYKELVSSERYIKLAGDIESIKGTSASIISFLEKKGRRGRPVLN